jgi:hypothetical protein
MNDTDIYADRHRVAYHPDPGTEDPATTGVNPGGCVPETTIRKRGETA